MPSSRSFLVLSFVRTLTHPPASLGETKGERDICSSSLVPRLSLLHHKLILEIEGQGTPTHYLTSLSLPFLLTSSFHPLAVIKMKWK